MFIKTKDLTFTYGKGSSPLSVKALSNVTLTVNEGEFLGIIGQTGSGKTTFVQHLNGLIRAQKGCGQVLVGEYDLTDKKCDLKGLRKKLGMVFQYPEYQLFAETVREDVAFGIKNFMPGLSLEQTEQMVKEAVETVGLNYEEIKDKSPFELSGGQKRRVAIAGVIVTKPQVLVLDEPVAGLDPLGKKEFLQLLHDLHGKFVKTIILVTHDMNVVSEHCTSACVFSKGKLLTVGSPKDVFNLIGNSTQLELGVPVTKRLMTELNKNGFNLDCDLSVDGFVSAVYEQLKGGIR